VAAVSYVLVYAADYVGGTNTSNQTLNAFIEYINDGGTSGEDLKKVLAAFVAPLTFLAAFIVINLILFIIYAIVGACTFSQGHIKKKERSQNREYRPSGVSRLISLAINLVICLTVASMLLVPVTYYAPLAYTAATSYAEMSDKESDGDAESESGGVNAAALTVLKALADNPLAKLYAFEGGVVSDNITVLDADGKSVKLYDFIVDIFPVITELKSLSKEDATSKQFYALADRIEKDAFADGLLGGLLQDAAKSWLKDEPFLGIEPPEMQSELVAKSVYLVLSTKDTLSESLRDVGHIYALSEALNVTEHSA
jgi:hypothetical protein